ncbi:TPA: hypothetical protein ACG5OU_003857, partial [Escherichia coli]
MNGDNPSPNRPLVTVVYKGPDFYDGEINILRHSRR